MAYQLIYTSVRSGLVAGRSGFCIAARHKEIKESLAARLEDFGSQYDRSLVVVGGHGTLPVIFSHRIVSIRGERYHILMRVGDAGNDYSGRTNHIAHALVVEEAEMSGLTITPAEAILALDRERFWRTEYTESARYFGPEDVVDLRRLSTAVNLPAMHWHAYSGSHGHAAALYEADGPREAGLLLNPGQFDPEQQTILSLFAEAQLMLSPLRTDEAALWSVPFSTLLQAKEESRQFLWCGCLPGAALTDQEQRAGRTMITLRHASPGLPQHWADVASGRDPYSAVVAPANDPADLHEELASATVGSGEPGMYSHLPTADTDGPMREWSTIPLRPAPQAKRRTWLRLCVAGAAAVAILTCGLFVWREVQIKDLKSLETLLREHEGKGDSNELYKSLYDELKDEGRIAELNNTKKKMPFGKKAYCKRVERIENQRSVVIILHTMEQLSRAPDNFKQYVNGVSDSDSAVKKTKQDFDDAVKKAKKPKDKAQWLDSIENLFAEKESEIDEQIKKKKEIADAKIAEKKDKEEFDDSLSKMRDKLATVWKKTQERLKDGSASDTNVISDIETSIGNSKLRENDKEDLEKEIDALAKANETIDTIPKIDHLDKDRERLKEAQKRAKVKIDEINNILDGLTGIQKEIQEEIKRRLVEITKIQIPDPIINYIVEWKDDCFELPEEIHLPNEGNGVLIKDGSSKKLKMSSGDIHHDQGQMEKLFRRDGKRIEPITSEALDWVRYKSGAEFILNSQGNAKHRLIILEASQERKTNQSFYKEVENPIEEKDGVLKLSQAALDAIGEIKTKGEYLLIVDILFAGTRDPYKLESEPSDSAESLKINLKLKIENNIATLTEQVGAMQEQRRVIEDFRLFNKVEEKLFPNRDDEKFSDLAPTFRKNENHQFNSLKQFLDTINNFIGYARDISKRDEGKEFNKIVGSYQGYSEIQEAKKQWNELTEEFRKITIDNSDKYSKEFADGWISLFTEEHMPHIEEYFRLPEGNRNLRSVSEEIQKREQMKKEWEDLDTKQAQFFVFFKTTQIIKSEGAPEKSEVKYFPVLRSPSVSPAPAPKP